jgi:hypothetical protein
MKSWDWREKHGSDEELGVEKRRLFDFLNRLL